MAHQNAINGDKGQRADEDKEELELNLHGHRSKREFEAFHRTPTSPTLKSETRQITPNTAPLLFSKPDAIALVVIMNAPPYQPRHTYS